MQRKFAAAVELPVKSVFFTEFYRAVFAVALLEVRRQPAHADGAAYLLADAVYEHRVLMARQCQCRAEIVELIVLGEARRFQQAQPEALGAALAALRLVLKPLYALVIVLALPRLCKHTDLVGKSHALDELDLSLEAAVKFLLRVDIGVIPQQRHVEILREIFQHRAGAGAAAAVQQHSRHSFAALLDYTVQFLLIISVHSVIVTPRAKIGNTSLTL